jgi:nucleotide-binding universal stress UspA family protein
MKMLICSDGSAQAEQAVRTGSAIAVACKSETTLLGVIENPGGAKAILEALSRGQATLQARNLPTELITKTGKPVEEIVRRTREANYDLVVVGAARKERSGAFWLSSKTYRIIKEIMPPVLTVSGSCGPIKQMLICSGGKPYIDSAVRLSGEIACSLGAGVTLLHVLPQLPAIYAHLPGMDESASWLLNSRSELGRNLRHSKELLESFNMPVEFRIRHGPVLGEILRELNSRPYEVVVSGSALSHSLTTYVLGDITREIVNRANCAILVARSQSEPWNGLFRAFSRFLPHGHGTL